MFSLSEEAVLSCEKMKDAERTPDIYLQLRQIQLADGSTSCVAASGGPKPSKPLNETSRQALVALRKVGKLGATYKEWLTESGLDASTFKRSRKTLEEAKCISKEGRYYVLTTVGRLELGERVGVDELDALIAETPTRGNGAEHAEKGSGLNQGSQEAHEPGTAQGSKGSPPIGVSPEPKQT